VAFGGTSGLNPGKFCDQGVIMRVLLISGNREDVDIRVPALGLACVAAATEAAGYETRLLDLMTTTNPRRAVECLAQFHPEVGGPGETKESVIESLDFAESLELDSVKLRIGDLASIAMRERLILSEKDLLLPKFYIAEGLESWLYETVSARISANPHWNY